MSEHARIAADLRSAVATGARILAGASEARAARRPVAGAWCAREVLGHLIDSACNNHRRFIINHDAGGLIVDPYQQEDWVTRQAYAATPIADLLPLWMAYNAHIARVIDAMPDEVLTRPRGSLAGYAFPYMATPPGTDYVTLAYLADDYVGHIRHHLTQIESLLGDA